MSSPLRNVQKVEGNDTSFPPLMNTMDIYVDASSDIRYAQVVDKVRSTNKKKVVKKIKKKNTVLSPLDHIPADNTQPPESGPHSLDHLTEQYHLRRYSASEREDYVFGSVSLESAPKLSSGQATRKVFMSSPPLIDKRPGKGNFPPRSPARVIVQPGSAGAYAFHKSPESSPTEVRVFYLNIIYY